MKYAFTTFSCPDASLDEVLRIARSAGYDGIEIRLDAGHGHGIEIDSDAERRIAIRRQVEAAGIEIPCLGTSVRYADPATLSDQIAATRAAIDLAADLGTPLIRVFGGNPPAGIERDDARQRIIGALREVAGYAGERAVTVCLETHDAWTAPNEIAAIMEGVDHDAVGVVWDVMHPVRTGGASMEDAFAAIRPWIRHVHIHDGSADPAVQAFYRMGTGDLDHRVVIRLLQDAGYTGFLSGEWMAGWMDGWDPFEMYLPREVETLRQYEDEAAV